MAVRDLWHKRGAIAACPLCGQQAGPPSARHGRGLRWRVDVPGHPAEHFRQKGQAERREMALWNTPAAPAAGERIDDMVRLWRDAKNGLSPKGQEAADYAAQYVLARWAGTKLDQFDADDIRAWVGSLTTPNGPASLSTRTKVLQCLKGALQIAVRRQLIPANPALDVKVRAQRVREGRYLSVMELRRIAQAMDEHHAELNYKHPSPSVMMWVLASTGLRIGEACAANVGDVDVERRRLRVRAGKGDKARDVPLTQFTLGLLDLERKWDEPLLVTPKTGKRVQKDRWRANWFTPAVRAAGLGDVTPHDLRHTAVSMAIASGASVLDVQRMCGHSTPAITLSIYGHLMDGSLDDVATRMNEIFAG